MHARVLMILSAAFLALAGLLTAVFPEKVLATHGTVPDNATLLLIQMMGALYLGFAVLNWLARGQLVDGRLVRPIAFGNLLHFGMVAILLWKAAAQFEVLQLAGSAAVFSAFAVWFGLVLFRR